jgi:hypothetical protein
MFIFYVWLKAKNITNLIKHMLRSLFKNLIIKKYLNWIFMNNLLLLLLLPQWHNNFLKKY